MSAMLSALGFDTYTQFYREILWNRLLFLPVRRSATGFSLSSTEQHLTWGRKSRRLISSITWRTAVCVLMFQGGMLPSRAGKHKCVVSVLKSVFQVSIMYVCVSFSDNCSDNFAPYFYTQVSELLTLKTMFVIFFSRWLKMLFFEVELCPCVLQYKSWLYFRGRLFYFMLLRSLIIG